MDQRNYMMQSRYPDPEASQLQNTAWNGQHINGEGGPFGIGEQTWNSSYAPIVDGYYGGQAFDTGMTGMDGDEEGNIHWGRPLPGEDGNVDSLLEGYDSDPDYLAFQNSLKKLRAEVLQLREDHASDDEDRDVSKLLGISAARKRKNGKIPKPRGRRPGVKVGPRKAAELTGDLKMRLHHAEDAFMAGEYYETALIATEVIRLNAEVPKAWQLLSSCFVEAGREALAVTCLIYAAEMSPKDVGAWTQAATMALEQKSGCREYHLMQASFCYAGGIRADPKGLECRYGKAYVLEERGHRTAAISECKYILARSPQDGQILRMLAELCIDEGKPEIAIEAYKTSISYMRNSPIDEAAIFDWTQIDTYVTLYECIGQWYSAMSELKSLSRWLLLRGDELFWDEITGNDCEWDVDESRRLSVPGHVPGKHPSESYELPLELRIKLGLLRLNARNPHEAMHHFRFLEPYEEKILDYPHLFKQVGDELYKSNLFQEALKFYEPLKNVPEYFNAPLLVQIARSLLRLHKEDLAEQLFRDAIKLDDEDVESRMELAKIHEGRKETQKAFDFVNEVMLLRKSQHQEALLAEAKQKRKYTKRADRKDPDAEEASMMETTKKTYRPRALAPAPPKEQSYQIEQPQKQLQIEHNSQPERQSRDEPQARPQIERQKQPRDNPKKQRILSKAEELGNHYQTLREEHDYMRAGDMDATEAWLEAAAALTDDFRSCKAFYPWDKYVKFMGYSGESRFHAVTPLDADLTAMADRLSKELGANLANDKTYPPGKIPTEYRSLSFSEWLDIFLEYALCLARNERPKDAYEICESLHDCTVFYHNREDMFLAHLCWCLCALICNDEEACVNQARYFMIKYQFTNDSYRLFAALSRAIHSPISWYSAGPSQKYVLRQIKCMDLALVDDKLKKKMAGERGTYSAVDDKGGFIINEDMDLSLIMLYGHILFTGQSYSFALNYFFRAHALDPDNEVINLCIGLSYIHHGLKRQAENRQHNILQGTTFMFLYYESRKTSEHLEERQEAHYNMARVYHMLGLPHLALPYYQKVLDEVANGRHSEREDLVMDTAYNLQTMYSSVGNMELAREVTERWLVI